MKNKTIAVIATLDTKGPETAFVKSRIEAEGITALIVDTGILEYRDPDTPRADFTADRVASEGGENRKDLIARASETETRNRGIKAMTAGSTAILKADRKSVV